MALFKKISEVLDFFPVPLTLDLKLINPVIPDAQAVYLKPFLGAAQLSALETWYDNNKEAESVSLAALLPYAQRVLIRFAIFMSVEQLDLQLTNSGFVVTSNQNQSPASPERVAKFKASMEKSGWDAVELLLRFLEENKSTYAAWASSEACTLALRNLVNSAEEFDRIVPINQSRLTFHRFRPAMDQVEYLKIHPVISKALFDEIITQIKAGNVSVANNVILSSLKKALAYFVGAHEIDQKYYGLAEHYLTDVRKVLDASPDTYPLFKASDSYVEDRVGYSPFENEEDNTIFVFGQKG